jgi:hypothetical protein
MLSGLAGVWVESIVKRSRHVSVAVRNIQLGAVSLVAGVASVIFLDGETVARNGFFGGCEHATAYPSTLHPTTTTIGRVI